MQVVSHEVVYLVGRPSLVHTVRRRRGVVEDCRIEITGRVTSKCRSECIALDETYNVGGLHNVQRGVANEVQGMISLLLCNLH